MSPRPTGLKDIRAITFDCYGTLIDWEGGAKQSLRTLLKKRRPRDAGLFRTECLDELFGAWEWARIQQSYAPYRQIAAESLEQVAHAAFGFEYDITTASTLGFRTILVRRHRREFPPTPVPDLTGISVLPAPDGTFIHPIAADRTKTSIVAQSLSFKGLHLSPRRRATDWNPCFSGISQTPLHTCAPCHRRAGFVALQAARQPAGTGSAQILRSMSPNSRRVRCPSASRSQ